MLRTILICMTLLLNFSTYTSVSAQADLDFPFAEGELPEDFIKELQAALAEAAAEAKKAQEAKPAPEVSQPPVQQAVPVQRAVPVQQAVPEEVEEEEPEYEEEVTEEPEAEEEGAVPARQVVPEEVPGPETKKFSAEEIGNKGNWRKKKKWVRLSMERKEEIQDILVDVEKFKQKFYDASEPAEKALDTFYRESGFKKTKIKKTIESIKMEVESEKAKTKKLFNAVLSDLSEETKDEARRIQQQYSDVYKIEEETERKLKALEQLNLDINSIYELDDARRNRLNTLEEQLAEIESQSEQAEAMAEKSWYIIDDSKARESYYKIDGILENVKELQRYIKQDLFNDFNNIVQTTDGQIERAKKSITNLENYGITVKDQTEQLKRLRKQEEESWQKAEPLMEEKRKIVEQERPTRAARKKIVERTWYESIWDGIVSIAEQIKKGIVSLLYAILT